MKFAYCSLEISPKFRAKKCDFSPRENSNAGRKFANVTTKFQLEFVRTETKIQEL